MSRLTDRVERDLREIAAGADPSTSAWESIVARLADEQESQAPLVLALEPDRSQRRLWIAVAAATLVVVTGSIAVLVTTADDHISTVDPDPTTDPSVAPPSTVTDVPTTVVPTTLPPPSPFVGIWVSTDTDGSTQTMQILDSGGDDYEFVLHDDWATACSGAPATITGGGRLETDETMVIARPELTCDDGTTPLIGPPPQADLANYTFHHDPTTDELTDSFGVVWRRDGIEAPSPTPATAPAVSENTWPQSSLEEVREAQRLADAGDPAYTWQVEPQLVVADEMGTYLVDQKSEVVDRFLREVLGWDQYLFHSIQSDDGFDPGSYGVVRGAWNNDGFYRGIVYLRCAPGEANPLYPAESSWRGSEPCNPTIDDLHYETVSLDLAQLDRRGSQGIWVVSDWRMTTPFAQADPDAVEAEVTARLADFLQARVDGRGAEGLVDVDPSPEVPLLYATTTGAPYERYEIERSAGPWWPDAGMDFKVRLFADGGQTVVEQEVWWWETLPEPILQPDSTRENAQPVAVRYAFFGGEVTALAGDPWGASCGSECLEAGIGWISLAAVSPAVATGCLEDVTAPAAVNIGGIAAQAIDGTLALGGGECPLFAFSWVDRGNPVRLYLIDLPEGSSMPTLAIAVVADEVGHGLVTGTFDDVIEAATPVIESIEFHSR